MGSQREQAWGSRLWVVCPCTSVMTLWGGILPWALVVSFLPEALQMTSDIKHTVLWLCYDSSSITWQWHFVAPLPLTITQSPGTLYPDEAAEAGIVQEIICDSSEHNKFRSDSPSHYFIICDGGKFPFQLVTEILTMLGLHMFLKSSQVEIFQIALNDTQRRGFWGIGTIRLGCEGGAPPWCP